MSLFSRQALFVLLAYGMACHKPASAAQGAPTYYVLESIDAKPLPASWNLGGVTILTHWGKLWLFPDGNATRMDYETHTQPGVSGVGGGTSTAYSRYRIDGDSIKIAFHPCKAPCFLGYIGKISDSTLTLTAANAPQSPWPLYLYRRSGAVEPPPRRSRFPNGHPASSPTTRQ